MLLTSNSTLNVHYGGNQCCESGKISFRSDPGVELILRIRPDPDPTWTLLWPFKKVCCHCQIGVLNQY